MKSGKFLSESTKQLESSGIDSPRLCVELILGEVLGISRASLLAFPERELEEEALVQAKKMLERRARGEPLAYILGRKEFYSLQFKVGPAVLVPRPETELLVDLALEQISPNANCLFADFGTGSGCLLAALLKNRPSWRGLGLDISQQALHIAAWNIAHHKVHYRASLLRADFGACPLRPASFDFIVSNPPYISEADYASLNPEVRDFEPAHALRSPANGLRDPLAVCLAAERCLKPGGRLFMEIGCEQGQSVLDFFKSCPLDPKAWEEAQIIKDLAGLDRVLFAIRV